MKVLERRFLDTTTASVHAASIAFYKDHPVFSWFGGSREGAGDVAIYVHNLNNDGKTIIIGDKDLIPRWNPILVNIKDKLILFEKSGRFCDCWQTFIHNISDWTNDITSKEIYATATVLPSGLNGPVKSCPIIINNNLICGSSVETFFDWTSYIESYFISSAYPKYIKFNKRFGPIYVKDKKVYQNTLSGQTVKTLGIIQPTLWTTIDNDIRSIHAFFRSSNGLNKIYYSRCVEEYEDAENDWIDPVPTNLDNPNSAVDIVYHNDRLFLIHNPDSIKRMPLVLSEIVLHCGENLAEIEIVDQICITEKVDENISCISKELSYPYMIEHDGKLHLVYTYARIKVEYVTISI